MYFSCVEKYRINSRLQLVKTVQERYTHSGLPIFPPRFQFRRIVLLPGADVVLHYSAILLTGLCDFVICASVLEQLPEDTQASLEKHGHLFTLFRDDACSETAGQGLRAVQSYARKLYPAAQIELLLSAQDIADFLGAYPESLDIACMREPLPPTSATSFVEYYDCLDYLHRSGRVNRGTLIISPVDRNAGEVLAINSRTKISGHNLNRAMHGDEVYVEGDRVVGIYKRKLSTVVGTLCRIDGCCGRIRPIDRRLPDMAVYTVLGAEYVGRKVMVCFMEWKVDSPHPRGVIFKVLGSTGNIEDEVRAVMMHYDIDYSEDDWLAVLNRRREELGMSVHAGDLAGCSASPAPPTPSTVAAGGTPESLGLDSNEYSINVAHEEVKSGRRQDLRHLSVYSIDPIGCTDIDDALHCVQRDGYVEVGVHIADVSLYVKPNTPLDLEARHRSTTVYFPDRRIDMLPPFLSTDLCSLVQDKDRAAFSCIWRLDGNYAVVDTRICRSVIRSRGSLSYEEAYELLQKDTGGGDACGGVHDGECNGVCDGMPGNARNGTGSKHSDARDGGRASCIKLLMAIAAKLRKDRLDAGALELSTQEIYADANKDIRMKESIPTHYLVEEFMLLANISIARFVHRHNPEYSLLRKHPLPSAIDLDFVDCTSSKTINESLKRIGPENTTIVKRIITRSMQQALYFASGDSSDFYHYGLATDIYTHFTSPIRRYPDILVHRTLAYVLEGNEDAIDGLAQYVTTRACSFMNYRRRNAQNASQMVGSLYLYCSMEPRPMDATVVCAREGGYIIFIGEYGIEEFLPTGRHFKVFDRIRVSFTKDVRQYCTTWNIPLYLVE